MSINNIIKLTEPKRGSDFLVNLNTFVINDQFLVRMIPFLADIFVFSYPVYLLCIYLYAIYKKNIEHKIAALYIAFSAAFAVILNLGIQYIVDKQRPEQLVLSQNHLIFDHVPDNPFPSDHAAVSAAIAMAVLIRGIQNKSKGYIYMGIIFWIFSIVMCLSRIAAGVHWPTDILFGMLIGILSSLFILWDIVFIPIKVKIFFPLIRLEKTIFRVFGVKQ